MLIGGFQKFSLIDYPDKICSIIFTRNCNFRCGYCHNPELIRNNNSLLSSQKSLTEKDIFDLLEKRKNKIEAITITGGEPTLQPDIIDFALKIKKMGFAIKIDSNGTNPQIIKRLIKSNLVDYIAMDIKSPIEKYRQISNSQINTDNIQKSIEIIMSSEIDYEFRTTVVKSQLSIDDIEQIAKLIRGAKMYALQKFIPTKTIDKSFLKEKSYSKKDFLQTKKIVEKYVQKCVLR